MKCQVEKKKKMYDKNEGKNQANKHKVHVNDTTY